MNKLIPAPAAYILDWIASKEAPKGYDTVYGNNKIPTPLTQMTLADVIASGTAWTNKFGSSACGRYQFMKATLQGLVKELKLTGKERFDPDLQDLLAYHLLKRRKYLDFISGKIGITGFGNQLAMEWASFPVLTNIQGAHRAVLRGQTYYSGDSLNHALIKPEAVEAILTAALALAKKAPPAPLESPAIAVIAQPPSALSAEDKKQRVSPPITVVINNPPTAPASADAPGGLGGWWSGVLARLRAAYPPKA